jgi:hypothetical protein
VTPSHLNMDQDALEANSESPQISGITSRRPEWA